jgi:hypothetical protein
MQLYTGGDQMTYTDKMYRHLRQDTANKQNVITDLLDELDKRQNRANELTIFAQRAWNTMPGVYSLEEVTKTLQEICNDAGRVLMGETPINLNQSRPMVDGTYNVPWVNEKMQKLNDKIAVLEAALQKVYDLYFKYPSAEDCCIAAMKMHQAADTALKAIEGDQL